MKPPHRSSIDPGKGKEVTSRTLVAGGEIILFAFFTIALPACSVLEAQPSPANQQTSGQAVVSTQQAVANNQAEIATLTGVNGVDQQAIIEEINRDGQRTSYPGFSAEVPAPVVAEEIDIVEFNYEQADLRLVLEELADALDITILIDPSIDNRVSIRTSEERPLQENDIWPLMRLLTRDAGIMLERVGDVYNARRLPSNLPADIVTPDTLGNVTSARIAQVTPLTYVSSEAVIQVIAPMLEPDGAISQLGSSNLLVISGSEFQLQRVNQILMLIDADPFANQGMHLYQLSNANAIEVATELAEILLLIEGPNPAYQVRGIERINSILVTAPASRGFDDVSRWMQILDADSQQQVEQLFMYRVKHLAALELAETLSTVFEEEDEPVVGLAGVTDGFGRGPQFGVTGEADESQSGASQELASQSSIMPTTLGTNAAVSANLSVKIVADETTNSLLIRSSARDYRQLLTTISQLDVVPLQVMVNAVIAQITLNEDTRFGVDWSRIANDAVLDPISTTTSTNFSPNIGGLMFTKGFLDGSARVEATLEAIAVDNDVRLLARPSLTVSNNQEGEIQIGAEVPVEAGESISAGGLSTTNIQYRPTGIELYITPQINDDGVVNLTIRQVLSSVDSSTAGVNNNPVFNNQEISTTVVVRNGENIVLGGLIQTDNERLNTGVPGLNRLPVVGNLFSYQRDSIERRELFIVLRPEIINLNAEGGVQYSDILDRFELASELLEDLNIQ